MTIEPDETPLQFTKSQLEEIMASIDFERGKLAGAVVLEWFADVLVECISPVTNSELAHRISTEAMKQAAELARQVASQFRSAT
jgi:hypothetical protein